MRKIKLENWKVIKPNGKKSEENLLVALDVLVTSLKEAPRGINNFRIFSALGKAIEKAEKTNELVLEEREYEFLKDLIEKNIPAVWGLNNNLRVAIEKFLEAEEVN